MAISLEYGASTHVGLVRSNNEDSFFADADLGLWLIADGMGGHDAGEVASQIAKDSVSLAVRNDSPLTQAIEQAHFHIKKAADSGVGKPNMGTTMVALSSHGKQYQVAWVGDSRAYLWDGQKQSVQQISKDHSYVQSLVDAGLLAADQMRFHKQKNVITQSLGVSALESVSADSIKGQWKAGQKILLCSDGLSDLVDEDTLASIFSQHANDSAQTLADLCVKAALTQGGNDNVTVQVICAPVKPAWPVQPMAITLAAIGIAAFVFYLLI